MSLMAMVMVIFRGFLGGFEGSVVRQPIDSYVLVFLKSWTLTSTLWIGRMENLTHKIVLLLEVWHIAWVITIDW